jgi:hypothetical protein
MPDARTLALEKQRPRQIKECLSSSEATKHRLSEEHRNGGRVHRERHGRDLCVHLADKARDECLGLLEVVERTNLRLGPARLSAVPLDALIDEGAPK